MEGISSKEAARRCIEAMSETQDVGTRVALWRAATRYARQARENGGAGAAGRETAGQPLAARRGGSQSCDW